MKCTILIADNDRGVRRYCKQELEIAGYRVLLAGDGDEAFDVLGAFAVDLVILDEHMPRCTGLQTARRIKQWYPTIPVILFTADPDFDQIVSPLVDAAVIKTADIGALLSAVATLCPTPSKYGIESDRSHLGCVANDAECHL